MLTINQADRIMDEKRGNQQLFANIFIETGVSHDQEKKEDNQDGLYKQTERRAD